jgi:YD repeat-containing protein
MNEQATMTAIFRAMGRQHYITSVDLTRWFFANAADALLANHDWQSGWDTFDNTRAIHAARGRILRYKKGPGVRARVIFVRNRPNSIQIMLQAFPNARIDD